MDLQSSKVASKSDWLKQIIHYISNAEGGG
jgi:hypothetical protein